jgi:starch phosphorylase
MKHIKTYQVFPKLPASLSFLGVLTRNMWWSWKPEAIELFRRVDPRLWEDSGRNPIVFATQVSQERLQKLSTDDSFLANLERVKKQFRERVLAPMDHSQTPYGTGTRIAYFSMEFGIHESLPLFAGGLGVLAGDHLKSAFNNTWTPPAGSRNLSRKSTITICRCSRLKTIWAPIFKSRWTAPKVTSSLMCGKS